MKTFIRQGEDTLAIHSLVLSCYYIILLFLHFQSAHVLDVPWSEIQGQNPLYMKKDTIRGFEVVSCGCVWSTRTFVGVI